MLAVGKKFVFIFSFPEPFLCRHFRRASREEMLQRAGGDDGRGPRVPDGPAVNNMSSSGSKGFTFTQLP